MRREGRAGSHVASNSGLGKRWTGWVCMRTCQHETVRGSHVERAVHVVHQACPVTIQQLDGSVLLAINLPQPVLTVIVMD